MKDQTAQNILSQTKDTYDAIASDFDKTRSYLWSGLKLFKDYLKAGDKILDLGCGNGKLRLLFKDVKVEYIGADVSAEQIKFAESREDFRLANQKFVVAQTSRLPFADNTFDVVYFIAVFHHLPGRNLREKTLAEIKRVLKPGGTLVMTNWNRWKKDFIHYIFKYTLLKLIGKSELDFKDIYLPWMGGKALRYYHAFTLDEIKRLIGRSGLKLEENYLAKFDGTRVGSTHYLTAANLVTIAKK